MKPSTKTHVLKNSADNLHSPTLIDTARKVLSIESKAIAELGNRIDDQFISVVHHLNQCKHLVVTGVGKSGLIGKKISSTFSSIGLPSLFLHASEASHGDLGMISEGDTVYVNNEMFINNCDEGDMIVCYSTLEASIALLIKLGSNVIDEPPTDVKESLFFVCL